MLVRDRMSADPVTIGEDVGYEVALIFRAFVERERETLQS